MPEGVFSGRGRDPGCVFVVGPGGVGGSTVAAAFAVAAAARGAEVLLVAVGPTGWLVPLFGGPDVDDRGRELCRMEGGGRVRGTTVSVERAFVDLFEFKGVGGFLRRAATSASVPMITAATPGLSSLLQLGTIEAFERRGSADLIVVDCPPAAAGISFLGGAELARDVVRSERALVHADRVRAMYEDEARSGAVLVTSAEESSVTAGLGLADDLRTSGPALLCPVVNGCWPGERIPAPAGGRTRRGDMSESGATADAVLESTVAFVIDLIEREREAIQRLEDELGRRAITLPRLAPTRLGPADLRLLAARFGDRRR